MKLELDSTPELVEMYDPREPLVDPKQELVGRLWQGILNGEPVQVVVSLVVLAPSATPGTMRPVEQLAGKVLRETKEPRAVRPGAIFPAGARYYL